MRQRSGDPDKQGTSLSFGYENHVARYAIGRGHRPFFYPDHRGESNWGSKGFQDFPLREGRFPALPSVWGEEDCLDLG